MFYFDTNTDGPVILCLHGRWGRAETWIDFIRHYGEQYRVIAPDQRGHGLSSKPIAKYTTEELAEDIIDLLDFLKIDKTIIVGHSMGGAIAGYLAAEYLDRVNAVAILDKSASGPEETNKQPLNQIKSVDPLTNDWPMPFASLSEAMDFIQQATDSDLSFNYFMNSLVETVEGYQMMFSSQAIAANIAYYENWFHLLPKIKCPALLIRAKGNNAVSDNDFMKMHTLIPRCLAYEMSNTDHNVHLSDKKEFYLYFDVFLRSLSINQ
ncbi:alpha/beta hydrolase [Sporolactobacillus shoreicorticis]|uniref:Alpha/beta fold hydrolase n=1 Tax=Sporolactobacillus shoreicorticis TaxID=1923877 RepID=A0ABW5S8N2_9BACL|nr:alpha/beta hydrolase [Sporolactobacillus shoreicorticis]MCO7126888.1 alpha/beta hydrolase [Sporolactobacillus shoreicorticis]